MVETEDGDEEKVDNSNLFTIRVGVNRDQEILDSTVLHELVHSFTTYITIVLEEEIGVLNDSEKDFLEKVKKLHDVFLEVRKITSLSEKLKKTIMKK